MASPSTNGLLSASNNHSVSYGAVNSDGGLAHGVLTTPSAGGVAQQVIDGFDPDEDIHDIVRGVRLDEIVTLSQSSGAMHVFKQHSSLLASIYIPLVEYVKFIWETWSNIFLLTLKFELSFLDWALAVCLAFLATVILGILLLWCQFVNNPRIKYYIARPREQDKDLSLSDPTLFDALTNEQTEVAKKKLGIPIEESDNTKDLRVFDLDIAKFLLQLASIVYERAPIAIHETLEEITAGHKSSPPQATPLHRSAAASSARHMSMHRLFEPTKSPNEDDVRVCAPGRLVRDIWAHDSIVADKIEEAFKKVHQGLQHSTIVRFCQKKHIDYEPVSELHSSSSAYCSFFWDNKSNWIVVVFKGTSVAEYPEWVTNFTPTLTSAHEFLPDGYGRLHKGFKERLYPSKVSPLGETHPWDSIRYSLCKVAQKLSHMEGRASQINVWFAGHSLGSALMTLAYTRAISTPSDFAGYPIVFRDCYAFAAPVSADRVCSTKLNEALAAFPTFGAPVGHYPYARTLWRVRNAVDAAATLPPQFGDLANRTEAFYKTNPGAFAHLGAEIRMKDGPAESEVASPCDHFLGKPSDYDRLPWPVTVELRSGFTLKEIKDQREKRLAEPGEASREDRFKRAEKIPLIGRFSAHDTAYYWDKLDRMAASRLKWVKA